MHLGHCSGDWRRKTGRRGEVGVRKQEGRSEEVGRREKEEPGRGNSRVGSTMQICALGS